MSVTGNEACRIPSNRRGHLLFVIIAFFVIIITGFAANYFNPPDSQTRSTSSSSCALSTDSNDDNVLVELIDLSSNSPTVRRWAQVRPGNIRSYTSSTMNPRWVHFFGMPTPDVLRRSQHFSQVGTGPPRKYKVVHQLDHELFS